jgi:hypothetical protein
MTIRGGRLTKRLVDSAVLLLDCVHLLKVKVLTFLLNLVMYNLLRGNLHPLSFLDPWERSYLHVILSINCALTDVREHTIG